MQDTIILSLLQKYVKDQCTEQELRTLFHWLKSPDNRTDLDLVVKPLWETIDKNMARPDSEREKELREEVALLLSGIGKESKNTFNLRGRNKNRLNSFYRVAAILILAFSVTFGLLTVLNRPSSRQLTYTEKICNKGEKRNILLSDGTKIVLNSDTKLRIPANFNEEERILEMTGEGFFEVAPNPEKPFVITSGKTQVSVLGTSFDFKSYAEDDFIKVTVSTGKVRVNVPSQDLQLSLTANEHLSVNKTDGAIRKETIQENNYIKWIKGSLYFNKEPITEVIKNINRTYNRKVILQCKDNNRIISGAHDNKSLEAVVEAICFITGLRSRTEGEDIIIYE